MKRRGPPLLTLDDLRDPTDAECARFDVAEVDLACAAGLPGSESLDCAACLDFVDRAAAWARLHTDATLHLYRADPDAYDRTEGVFRMVAVMSVLWRGMGVRYNADRIAAPEHFGDGRDDFLHGIVQGRGGTCASLPVLLAAVARRLGYPVRLVRAPAHLFCRWDDSAAGVRFNVEVNETGMNSHPDEHYLTWPHDVRGWDWARETLWLRSLTPRQEVAMAWSKRGHCLDSNGRLGDALDAFAAAASIESGDRLLDRVLLDAVGRALAKVSRALAARNLRISVGHRPARRYPGLPSEMERELVGLRLVLGLLDGPLPDAAHIALVPE
jgi:hypothetical protein